MLRRGTDTWVHTQLEYDNGVKIDCHRTTGSYTAVGNRVLSCV